MIARGDFDGVIRIGNVPTLRFWRDLESRDAICRSCTSAICRSPGCTRGEMHPLDALPDDRARDRDEAFFARRSRNAPRDSRASSTTSRSRSWP